MFVGAVHSGKTLDLDLELFMESLLCHLVVSNITSLRLIFTIYKIGII